MNGDSVGLQQGQSSLSGDGFSMMRCTCGPTLTDRQTDRPTNRQTTNRQTDERTDEWTNGQTDTHTQVNMYFRLTPCVMTSWGSWHTVAVAPCHSFCSGMSVVCHCYISFAADGNIAITSPVPWQTGLDTHTRTHTHTPLLLSQCIAELVVLMLTDRHVQGGVRVTTTRLHPRSITTPLGQSDLWRSPAPGSCNRMDSLDSCASGAEPRAQVSASLNFSRTPRVKTPGLFVSTALMI